MAVRQWPMQTLWNTEKSEQLKSWLESRPWDKVMSKSEGAIVLFLFCTPPPVRLGSCGVTLRQHAVTTQKHTHIDIRWLPVCFKTTCLQSWFKQGRVIFFIFFFLGSSFFFPREYPKPWSLPRTCSDTGPERLVPSGLRVIALQNKKASIHIKTQHLRQLPDGVFRFCKAARVAVSNTSQIPSLVLAEHSK